MRTVAAVTLERFPQFRRPVSAENSTNRVNFADFNGVLTSSLFGVANRALNPRRIELTARFAFQPMEHIPVRVLVDTDPVFTQVRHLTNVPARTTAANHTCFFSFGENIGQAGCTIPADGFTWQPTRQPIVMDAWTCTPGPSHGPLSTIMLWDSYPSAEHNGTRYGMKAESFTPYVDLPARSDDAFELALGSPTGPREHLTGHGWKILDPRDPTRDPWTYQDYIRRSKAEFSVAKQGYVVSQSGWFSERSAAYLASGRPVVLQDTAFSRWLRARSGVFAFSNAEDALAQLESLNRSYDEHCRSARAIAEEYFGSAQVLTRLLDAATCGDAT